MKETTKPPLDGWIYRVVAQGEELSIMCVFHRQGVPVVVSKDMNRVVGYEIGDLRRRLRDFREATKLPILKYEDIKL